MKAIGYVRVSTDKQENSADAQEKRIRAYALLHGMDLVDVIVDQDSFSGDLNRTGVQRILAMMKAREIDALIVAKLDRLSRSTRDTSDLMALSKKTGVKIIDIAQSLDMSCAIGRFIVNIRAAVAEYEREMIGERTSEGLQNLKAQGFPAGPAPFGWTSQPRTAQEKELKIRKPLVRNEVQQSIIVRIAALRSQRLKWEAVAEALNSEGYRTRPTKRYPEGGKWHDSAVQRVFAESIKKAA